MTPGGGDRGTFTSFWTTGFAGFFGFRTSGNFKGYGIGYKANHVSKRVAHTDE